MSRRKKKLVYILSSLTIIVLISSAIYLYFEGISLDKELKELKNNLDIRKKQESFIEQKGKDLDNIKELKQRVLGQESKLEEYSKQIESFNKKIIENKKILDKLES